MLDQFANFDFHTRRRNLLWLSQHVPEVKNRDVKNERDYQEVFKVVSDWYDALERSRYPDLGLKKLEHETAELRRRYHTGWLNHVQNKKLAHRLSNSWEMQLYGIPQDVFCDFKREDSFPADNFKADDDAKAALALWRERVCEIEIANERFSDIFHFDGLPKDHKALMLLQIVYKRHNNGLARLLEKIEQLGAEVAGLRNAFDKLKAAKRGGKRKVK
jgi:hypothetical protein